MILRRRSPRRKGYGGDVPSSATEQPGTTMIPAVEIDRIGQAPSRTAAAGVR